MSNWHRPRPKMYEYNYQIQSSHYRPVLSILNKKEEDDFKAKVSVNSSLAKESVEEVQQRYSKSLSAKSTAAEESNEQETTRRSRVPESPPRKYVHYSPSSIAGYKGLADSQYDVYKKESSVSLQQAKKSLEELEEKQFPQREPLWKVHPYYVPVDFEQVPPREDSIWPESRKHFDLVSSYDLMVGFVGIKGMAEREMAKNARRGN